MIPRLARIRIYPIKSLDPLELSQVRVLPSGALEGDRRYALFDTRGRIVNGKRTARLHTVRAAYDLAAGTVSLHAAGTSQTLHLERDRAALEELLSRHLEQPVILRENPAGGFPDDTDSPGPTVIAAATLEEVAGWYGGMSHDEARLRFRANLEIEGVEPFWEDRLYGEAGDAVPFRVGEAAFLGTNPCQRCVVPTRDAASGEKTPDFASIFEQRRYETFPDWGVKSRFDHFYRLAVNTRPAGDSGGVLRVGDAIVLPA